MCETKQTNKCAMQNKRDSKCVKIKQDDKCAKQDNKCAKINKTSVLSQDDKCAKQNKTNKTVSVQK